jgi:hypothetical protein
VKVIAGTPEHHFRDADIAGRPDCLARPNRTIREVLAQPFFGFLALGMVLAILNVQHVVCVQVDRP